MFCPGCGLNQSNELKFCKQCGANLQAIRQAVMPREAGEKFDWSKTWVAEMFLSEGERKRRQEEIEKQRGITPEVKRYNEIKGGVITSMVGVALMIFLYFFMEGIIRGGTLPREAVEIVSRIWIVGVIPFLVGLALIINGVFVSKKQAEVLRQQFQLRSGDFDKVNESPALPAADTSGLIPSSASVTEGTTRHLSNSDQ